jgi:hypothetical protein
MATESRQYNHFTNNRRNARFVVFTGVKVQVEVFWTVIPCSVVGYQRFGGPYCLYLQVEEAERTSEAFVSYHNTAGHHRPEDLDLR